MAIMDNFLKAMNLGNEDEDYENEEYFDDPDDGDAKPVASSSNTTEERKPALKPISRTRKTGNGMEVCVIKPTSVDDSREITDTLLANRTVVLNMEGLDVDIAHRIIDFTSGSTYAIKGKLQKISHYIFIITPASVDISGDFPEIFGGSSFDVPNI